MIVVGLTGGIATGKLGAKIIDCDQLYGELVAPGSPLLARLVEAFGTQYLLPDGSLARAALGKLVFTDRVALARLNAITHPPLLEAVRQRLRLLQVESPPAAIVEAAVLFEMGAEALVDCVVVTSASKATQVRRLSQLGFSAEQAQARLAAQSVDWRSRADYLIDTDRPLAAVEAQVREIWPKILSRTPARRWVGSA